MPRSRVLRAGLVAGATGAALLVAPQAAHAAPTAGPPLVAPGGTVTITDPAVTYGATVAVQLGTASCAAKPAAPSATLWTPAVTARTSSSVAFALPASGPVAGPNGAVKAYNACVYDTVATTGVLIGSTTILVGWPATAGPAVGLTGAGGQVTVTTRPDAPAFTGATALSATFTTGTCTATAGTATPAGLVASNVTRQSATAATLTVPPGAVTGSGAVSTAYSICLYDGTGALLTVAPYTVNLAAVTPSAGSYLSSNAVVVTSPQPYLTGIASPGVLLVAGGPCPAAYGSTVGTPVTGSAVRRISSNRVVVNVPPLPLTNNQATPYQICVYGNGALIAAAGWTAAPAANPTSVTPSAGPAAGGSTITVLGTDFPTDPSKISATLGGVPLTNIQVISDRAFTAQTQPHPVEDNVALVVTTPLGTKTLVGAYSYLNPIRISPNTAPSSAGAVEILVQGTGLLSIPFGTGGNAARIYLVNGVYNGADAGDTAGSRVNGPVAECVNVLPLSDDELICTLQLNRRLNASGNGYFEPSTYSAVIDGEVTTIAGSRIVTSGQGRFSRNDTGQVIWSGSPTFAPGTTIAAVLSPNRALLSGPAMTSGVTYGVNVGGQPVRTLGGQLSSTAGSTTVSLTGGSFSRADVGRTLGGVPGVPAGTTIVAIGPGGGTATLSAPATTGTATTVTGVNTTDGTSVITSSGFTGNEPMPATVGPNSLGIPVGTPIQSFAAGSANLATPVTGTTAGGTLTVNRPVNAMLYPGSPVPDGSYHLTIVSNGMNDAALNDPDYFQTDVTSSSTFTVAPF